MDILHHVGRLVLTLIEGERFSCDVTDAARQSPHAGSGRVVITLASCRPGRSTLAVEACRVCWLVLRGALPENSRVCAGTQPPHR